MCESSNHELETRIRALLAVLYVRLTDTSAGGLRSAEGFDRRDLKDAKTLLSELAT